MLFSKEDESAPVRNHKNPAFDQLLTMGKITNPPWSVVPREIVPNGKAHKFAVQILTLPLLFF